MKKLRKPKKLTLRRETISVLTNDLRQVVGGKKAAPPPTAPNTCVLHPFDPCDIAPGYDS